MNSLVDEMSTLLARRELWLLVSVGFVDPHHRQRFEVLRDPAFRQRTMSGAAFLAQEHSEIALGFGEVNPKKISSESLFAALDKEYGNIEAIYRKLFGLTAVSAQCPPCEIEFEPNLDLTYRSQHLSDAAGFYQAFGLEVSTCAGERLDHITVESEFLYVLLAKEAAALHERNQEGAEICREARRKFFQEHVGWWLPAFTRLLSHAAPSGFYGQLATLTAGLCAVERASLELPPFGKRIIPKPSSVEAEALCFGCADSS